MKKLSVLVALIMAITVFWIPGQSVFADNEEVNGADETVVDEAVIEALDDTDPTAEPTTDPTTEPTTEPTTQPTTEPVTPEFIRGTTTRYQTQIVFNWYWTEGEGAKSVKIWFWKKAIRDRNSSYTYYLENTDGRYFSGLSDGTVYRYTMVATLNGKQVFYEDGTVTTAAKKANGWLTEGAKQYYYVNGVKQRNKLVKINADGATLNHYFDCNGVFRGRSDYMYSRVKGLSSKAYLICVDRTNNVTCVYRGGKNNWTPLKYWSCVTGRMKKGDYHPTPLGVYKVKSKKTTFSGYGIPEKKKNRYSVWYCTRFTGSVFFHSQLYKYKSKSSFIPGGAAMGRNASHGCIRLHKANAYWVYKNCAKGTTVVIIQ